MKFSIKDFFIKCDKIRSFLRIQSHLLKKSLMDNFIFCTFNLISISIFFLFKSIDCVFINTFLVNFLILYPLKTPESLWLLVFSWDTKWERWPKLNNPLQARLHLKQLLFHKDNYLLQCFSKNIIFNVSFWYMLRSESKEVL